MFVWLSVLVVAAPGSGHSAVTIPIVSGRDAAISAEAWSSVEATLDTLAEQKVTVLTDTDVSAALAVDADVEILIPDPGAELSITDLNAMHRRASALSANWKGEQALVVLHALLAKILTSGPSSDIFMLGIQTAIDIAAIHLEKGHSELSLQAAIEAQRRFGVFPVDPRKFPPALRDLFEFASQADQPQTKVTLQTSSPGLLYAGPRVLGLITEDSSLSIPNGSQILRLHHAERKLTSLPRRVDLNGADVTLFFDLELESRLLWRGASPLLVCSVDCPAFLKRLGKLLRAERVVGVRVEAPNDHIDVRVPREDAFPQVAEREVLPQGRSSFHPMHLAPLGVAQFYQRRWVWGSAYLATCLALASWHIAARVQFDQLNRPTSGFAQLNQAASWKVHADVSFWVLVGAVVATSIEGVLVGLLSTPEHAGVPP